MSWERRLQQAAGVAIALSLTGSVLPAQKASPGPADLAGTWVLAQDQTGGTEKPAGNEDRGRAGGSTGGLTGGVPGAGTFGLGGSGGRPDEDKLARMRRIMKAELAPVRLLVVTADGGQLTVTADDGRPEVVFVDGRKHLRLTGEGEINTITRWTDGQLVSVRRYDEGLRATRTFRIQTDAGGIRQLVVILTIEGGGLSTFEPLKRVYRAQ